MTSNRVIVAASVALAGMPALCTAQPGLFGVGFLESGSKYSECYGVSEDGSTVVGIAFKDDLLQGFRWRKYEGMISIGTLGGVSGGTVAYAVSGDGTRIVGAAGTPTGAVSWTQPDGLVRLDPLWESRFSVAYDVSKDGRTIVGMIDSDRPFRWSQAGGFQTEFLSESGEPLEGIGYAVSDDGKTVLLISRGEYLWVEGRGGRKLENIGGVDLSGNGLVVVGAMHSDTQEAARWTEETGSVALPRWPGSTMAAASATNYDGSVILMDVWQEGGVVSGIWIEGRGTFRLVDYLEGLGVSTDGWILRGAYDISSDGTTIVGRGSNPAYESEGWIARIGTRATRCRIDCTEDGRLNVNDFICFQSEWRRRGDYGDYDGSGAYTVNDFIRFQADFVKGCP